MTIDDLDQLLAVMQSQGSLLTSAHYIKILATKHLAAGAYYILLVLHCTYNCYTTVRKINKHFYG